VDPAYCGVITGALALHDILYLRVDVAVTVHHRRGPLLL
jgi:hypothetical protein